MSKNVYKYVIEKKRDRSLQFAQLTINKCIHISAPAISTPTGFRVNIERMMKNVK